MDDAGRANQEVPRISMNEVRAAMKKIKSGKPVGPDDILVEAWKCLVKWAKEFLTRLFKKILESENMPEEWRKSVLVSISKNKVVCNTVAITEE